MYDMGMTTVLERLQTITDAFIMENSQKITKEDINELPQKIKQIDHLFRTPGPLEKYHGRAKVATSLAIDYAQGVYTEVDPNTIKLVVYGLLYVVREDDIIPDSLPIVGQLDDVIVFNKCCALAQKQLDTYKVWKIMQSKPSEGTNK